MPQSAAANRAREENPGRIIRVSKQKDHICGLYAVNFFLPLNLLLFKTFLPFFVLILFLKPCSTALCLFLGCNVCFNPAHLLILSFTVAQSQFQSAHNCLVIIHLMDFAVNIFVPARSWKHPLIGCLSDHKSIYSCPCENFAQSFPQIVDNSGKNIFLAISILGIACG